MTFELDSELRSVRLSGYNNRDTWLIGRRTVPPERPLHLLMIISTCTLNIMTSATDSAKEQISPTSIFCGAQEPPHSSINRDATGARFIIVMVGATLTFESDRRQGRHHASCTSSHTRSKRASHAY